LKKKVDPLGTANGGTVSTKGTVISISENRQMENIMVRKKKKNAPKSTTNEIGRKEKKGKNPSLTGRV